MSRYSDEFLLDVANSCGCPDYDPDNYGHGEFVFEANGGWKVEVFYNGGMPEYINRFISPAGRDVGSWDDNGTESRNKLISWAGIGSTG